MAGPAPKKMKMEMEMEMAEDRGSRDRYLCVGSEESLVCIDLVKTNANLIDKEEAIAHVADKVDLNGSIVGIRPTGYEFNNNSQSGGKNQSRCGGYTSLYLVGGETITYTKPLSGRVLKEYAFNNKMFKVFLKPASTSGKGKEVGGVKLILEEVEESSIPRMRSGKGQPIVEVINGKLYVLHTVSVNRSPWWRPEAVFEVFDPETQQWNTLKHPFTRRFPFSPHDDTFTYHTVIDTRLFVVTRYFNWLLSYNTTRDGDGDGDEDNRDWSLTPSEGEGEYSNVRDFLPIKVVTVLPNNLYIGISISSLFPEPVSLIFNSHGKVTCYEPLPLIFQELRPTVVSFLSCVFVPLQESESESELKFRDVVRLCICASFAAKKGCALMVSIFDVYVNIPTHEDICISKDLQVDVVKSFVFNVPDVDYDFFFLQGPVFFLTRQP